MKMIEFNGQHVYTHALNPVTMDDIKKCIPDESTIKDAYFFKFSPGKGVVKVEYNFESVKSRENGLMVDVNLNPGQASMPIAGLEEITGFLDDNQVSPQNLSSLKDKKTIAYMNQSIRILAIGIEAYIGK